eukprot:gene27924-36786_t
MTYEELIRILDDDEYESFNKTLRAFQSVMSITRSARENTFLSTNDSVVEDSNKKYEELIRNLDQESYDNFIRNIKLVEQAMHPTKVHEMPSIETESIEMESDQKFFEERVREQPTSPFKSSHFTDVLPSPSIKKVYEYGENELDQHFSKVKVVPKPYLINFEREWTKNKFLMSPTVSEEFRPKDLSAVSSSKDLLLILRDSDRKRAPTNQALAPGAPATGRNPPMRLEQETSTVSVES